MIRRLLARFSAEEPSRLRFYAQAFREVDPGFSEPLGRDAKLMSLEWLTRARRMS
jgi:hypothetical protein